MNFVFTLQKSLHTYFKFLQYFAVFSPIPLLMNIQVRNLHISGDQYYATSQINVKKRAIGSHARRVLFQSFRSNIKFYLAAENVI
jgi:hypothetical protein